MSPALGRDAEHARVGDELEPCEKIIYQRALAEREFSAESIHNDDYTRRQGYPGALVSAYVLCGYMSEPLVRYFGSSWFRSGEISLRFIGKGVQQHDHVRCGGTVREIVQDGDGSDRRVVLDLWMEKENGVRPVVGTASAVVPGRADQSVAPTGSGRPEQAFSESRE
jgi:hypothetical protein